jgi:hypothetical protein
MRLILFAASCMVSSVNFEDANEAGGVNNNNAVGWLAALLEML